ncbi:MAG: dTDP-4-amino-4,6-dideoxygalactose transaminase [Bacteroidetes bacterium ADurb.Bin217]|nr:MAG: dTDP-4-amino-4,6-dideoxygalactose transaminase [Bacteroidetes bacterium ADurb.Bin217]
MPSFTFVSTAIAFIRQGAIIKFVDSRADHPGMDEQLVEELITPKTKAIVVVHYAGVACDMDVIMDIATRHNLFVVEDAAQAIDSYYTNTKGEKQALGSIGHLGAFSFHETKNIQCGEGGMLCINDERFIQRAEILWEKGTNRAEFFRGEVNKYGWVDIGSSFLPSEINAAFLWAQLENLQDIQRRRLEIWNEYRYKILDIRYQFPVIPEYASNNAHMFYLVCSSLEERTEFITKMKKQGVSPVFHYQSLHASEFYKDKHDGRVLPHADRYTDCLVRLPLFYEVDEKKVIEIMGNC